MKTIQFTSGGHELSGMYQDVERPLGALVVAHGAREGMRQPILVELCNNLAQRRIATLRFNFPFLQQGKKTPNSPEVAVEAISTAIDVLDQLTDDIPIFIGGKSYGARMCAHTLEARKDSRVQGLVSVGFPLHSPNEPDTARARVLTAITVPMLFFQGSRDELADLRLMKGVVRILGKSRATLHVINGADHAFTIPPMSEKTQDEVYDELAEIIYQWWPIE